MITRFAAIADIHGNADALRAVLAHIDGLGIATIVNLGDHFSGPLAAAETATLLRARPALSLRGNHDRYLIDHPRTTMHSSDAAAYDQLGPGDLDWLRTLPPDATLGDAVYACHATPQDDETYWLEALAPDGTPHLASLTDIAQRARGLPHPVLLCAHSHIPRSLRLPTGQILVNPGSVGCPAYDDINPVPHVMQTGTPCASYATLAHHDDGWQVSHHLIPYDPASMVALARARGRTDWATALGTGWLMP